MATTHITDANYGTKMFPAWTSYSPTPTPQTGSFTTVTATGYYRTLGKTTFVQVTITMSDIGTGTGILYCTLPNNAQRTCILHGVEQAVTGATVQGRTAAASNSLTIVTYAGGSIISNGYVVVISGVYENE